jgi:IS30 family transposase
MQLVPPCEPGEKLRPIDEAMILEMSSAGKSQTEIADAVGCHQSTVSRTLAEWTDSRELALN